MAALIRFATPEVGYRAPCLCSYERKGQTVRYSTDFSGHLQCEPKRIARVSDAMANNMMMS